MGALRIRRLAKRDRAAIRTMLGACGLFSREEVRVALEVLDQALAGGRKGDYPHLVAECAKQVVGYVCIGRTPLTRTTWHEYWICVHPGAQQQGVGRALQQEAEKFVRAHGGERLVIETSGRPAYARTQRFYQRAGYRRVGRIRDYYQPGDDCVFYCKEVA